MKLILVGSGEFGLPTFERLARSHQIVAVLSQPDRPAGRKRHLTATPVAAWAQAQGLTIHKAENANDPATVERLAALQADAAVVIAFGQKLSPSLIEALGRLVVNLHASLLPRYRGAAPINWAIIEGEAQTGVSVIGLAQRMDAGLIYAQAATPIDPLETAGELHDRLATMGPAVIEQVLADFAAGRLQGDPQNEAKATRAPKLSKADGVVDLSQDAFRVRARIHGLTPWPGVTVQWAPGGDRSSAQPLKLLRVAAEPDMSCFPPTPHSRPAVPPPGTVLPDHRVAVGHGEAIRLLEVQPPGSRAMSIQDFVRGHRLAPGDLLFCGNVRGGRA